MPKVWNMRDADCPAEAVRIDRRTPLGNKFRIGKDGTRTQVLDKFRAWLPEEMARNPVYKARVMALRGKNVKCWCAPLPCHGDVLLEFANA